LLADLVPLLIFMKALYIIILSYHIYKRCGPFCIFADMGVDDFDSLSVTDSGVFSDNDGCSSGRSSPISCKEGTVGGERERFAILTYDQVKRVDCVLNEMVALEGRGNFPALELKLKDLLTAVKDRLHKEGIKVRSSSLISRFIVIDEFNLK
jgi:hypothetical protein